MDMDQDENENTNNSNSNSSDKQEQESDDEDQPDDDEENEYGIPWQNIEYEELPILYKLSILMNFCDWILCGNKVFRKLMNSNKKKLIMNPIFIDDEDKNKDREDVKYYLFGSESLQQCLYQTQMDESQSMNVYDFDEYNFKNDDEKQANNGMYFGNLKCVAIGMEGLREFVVKINGIKQPKLYAFLITKIKEMELLEKKKRREDRRKKMQQQRFARDFAFNSLETRYENDDGNRRSTRMKDKKKVSYKDVPSDADEEESEEEEEDEDEEEEEDSDDDENEDDDMDVVGESEEEPENTEPTFYPSGRQKRNASKKKVSYRY
eukprot:CAMPEP_0201571662 /NCGR_PEP_ID=MMETSP0190_2-20130828/14549_1 /ASSEMBLY_ACC=CAM_ASM_000263 /TAXON_ID=37353 /ORGANISM="Rosalina sp." /LENGTH=320 /DNA_ID=CAMNT_0047996547 /DNA_START=76 /DNA_END=1038 /DNA_ORIENTATION=-